MLRKGEVRVNSGRIKQTYRLALDDVVRIPPVYIDDKFKPKPAKSLQKKLQNIDWTPIGNLYDPIQENQKDYKK